MSFITHSKCRHTVSEWPFPGKKENQNPECRRRPLQGMECSKCGVAFVATCEIWFGEGCHLKGPGSAVMTAPEHSLTQSHCLSPPPLYRCISALSYLSFTHSLTPLSLAHSSPPSGSFYWAALKPDVPALRGRAGRRGDGGGDRGRGSRMTCSFRAAHSPHNRISLHPFSLSFYSPSTFYFSRISLRSYSPPPQKKNSPTYTNLLPLPLLCLSCNASDLVLSWTNHLIWEMRL